jgi:nonsense-mediated mRNA decay protein 3
VELNTINQHQPPNICNYDKNNFQVRLIDAGFIWTEPHSQRIKAKLTVQKEVLNAAVLQQVFVVEFIVKNHMCDDCHRVEAKDFWRACVQIRQKVSLP